MKAAEAKASALGLLREHVAALPFPKFLHLEPTNACPLRCVMCPRQEGRRPVGFLSLPLFERLVRECALRGPLDDLILHKDGEPLLHPDLPGMIAFAKRAGAARRVSFSTSGAGLDAGLSEALVRSGLDRIDVSIDGATPETYGSLRVRGDLADVEEGVKALVRIRKRLRSATPQVTLRILRTEPALSELPAFRRKWRGEGVTVESREFKTWAGRYPESRRAPEDRRPAERTPCFSPFTALAVEWDGTVTICSLDYDRRGVLGDANGKTLLEIWEGKALARARRAHLERRFGKVAACRDCADWQPYEEFWP